MGVRSTQIVVSRRNWFKRLNYATSSIWDSLKVAPPSG